MPELAESSVSSQISSYSFVTLLIEDDIKHEILDSSIVTCGGPYESPRADYSFIIVPVDSFSSELPEFLAMINGFLCFFFWLFGVCVLVQYTFIYEVRCVPS